MQTIKVKKKKRATILFYNCWDITITAITNHHDLPHKAISEINEDSVAFRLSLEVRKILLKIP